MAVLTTVTTEFGEEKELYMRINNVEVSNHGVVSSALFRGYISEESYNNGSKYMFEQTVKCTIDVKLDIWVQFYDAFKSDYKNSTDC